MRIRVAHLMMIGVTLVAVGVALISCTPDKTAPTLEPSQRAEIPSTVEASVSVAVAGTPVAEVPPFTDLECLECHTDQEMLIALAVAEEEGEKLSSGPG